MAPSPRPRRALCRNTRRQWASRRRSHGPGCADAKGPLQSWHDEATQAVWRSLQDIKAHYRHASIVGHNRVVFNIAGHKYRLVVEMQYRAGIAWVKFVGTHAQYDAIDVETVNEPHSTHSR